MAKKELDLSTEEKYPEECKMLDLEIANSNKTTIETDILSILESWECNDGQCAEFDALWYGYEALQDQINKQYSLKDLKKAMKSLKEKGKVELSSIYDSDFNLSGSGWFLSEQL